MAGTIRRWKEDDMNSVLILIMARSDDLRMLNAWIHRLQHIVHNAAFCACYK